MSEGPSFALTVFWNLDDGWAHGWHWVLNRVCLKNYKMPLDAWIREGVTGQVAVRFEGLQMPH